MIIIRSSIACRLSINLAPLPGTSRGRSLPCSRFSIMVSFTLLRHGTECARLVLDRIKSTAGARTTPLSLHISNFQLSGQLCRNTCARTKRMYPWKHTGKHPHKYQIVHVHARSAQDSMSTGTIPDERKRYGHTVSSCMHRFNRMVCYAVRL